MRGLCVILHRYLGLATALFLVLLGLTGSVLAWREPVSAWLAPELHEAPARGPVLTPEQLAQRVAVADPHAAIVFFPLNLKAGEGTPVRVGSRDRLGYDTLWLDPVSGHELGRTDSEAAWPTTRTCVDWLYHLHRQLAIPGRWGVWILGIVSLLWFFDCFIGAYLTFPRGHPVFRRWWPAWTVRYTRVNYDLHRAGGLWPWLLLAVMALSGVYFNLNQELFMPALRTVATVSAEPFDSVPPAPDSTPVTVTLSQAATIGLNEAHSRGWPAVPEGIYHDVGRRFWFIYFEKAESQWATAGSYGVFVDDRSGAVTYVRTPKGTAADVFVNWLSALHMGEVFGIPYKVVLCLLGLVVAGLSATGVLIWWRKLQSRHAMHRRKLARSGVQGLAARSLAALLCLVAGVLLTGALTGAFHNIL
jgi:uncharacterized iron-regulated membrane protein